MSNLIRSLLDCRNLRASTTGSPCSGRDAVSLLHRFGVDRRGNVHLIMGLLLPVIVGAVGAGVSFSSGNATRTNMQMALDAAVLAGLAESNPADIIATAQTVFQSNQNKFAQSNSSDMAAIFDLSANFNSNGSTLTGQASANPINPFGGIIGSKTYQVSVKSAAEKQKIPICILLRCRLGP